LYIVTLRDVDSTLVEDSLFIAAEESAEGDGLVPVYGDLAGPSGYDVGDGFADRSRGRRERARDLFEIGWDG
jgi:hypothetical protein